MYYVYIIKSKNDGSLYIGQTGNLEVRINQHNSGKCRYTTGRGPWVLIYSEEYSTREKALVRERYL